MWDQGPIGISSVLRSINSKEASPKAGRLYSRWVKRSTSGAASCRAQDERWFMAAEQPLVVLVDDDSSIRQALTRLFKSAGLRFLAFESAEEFLQSTSLNLAG